MDLHHGQVLLDSSPGKGSRFTLYLPLGKEHFREDEYEWIEDVRETKEEETFYRTQKEKDTKVTSGKKLLIIEDNDEIRSYIYSLFCKDYQVLEAHDGGEGVKIATEEIPDLIISDIMMPVKDGLCLHRGDQAAVGDSPYPGHHAYGKGGRRRFIEEYPDWCGRLYHETFQPRNPQSEGGEPDPSA